MNIPDHLSESLLKVFRVKVLKFFDADPGSGISLTLDPGWKNSYPGSATPDAATAPEAVLRIRIRNPVPF